MVIKKNPPSDRRIFSDEDIRNEVGLDALYLLDDGLEGFVVADGELGEDFAVELHLLHLERTDERAVARIEGAKGIAEADDPEGSECPLLVAAVTIGIGTGLHDGLLGQIVLTTATPTIAFGGIEEVVASFAGGNATLYTGHNVSTLRMDIALWYGESAGKSRT